MGVSSLLYIVPDQSYGLTYLYRALPRVFGLYSIYSIGEDMCTYIYRKFIRTARLKTQRLPLYPFRNKRMCVLKVLFAMNFSIMSDESLLDEIPIVVCRPNNVILPVNIWPFTFFIWGTNLVIIVPIDVSTTNGVRLRLSADLVLFLWII